MFISALDTKLTSLFAGLSAVSVSDVFEYFGLHGVVLLVATGFTGTSSLDVALLFRFCFRGFGSARTEISMNDLVQNICIYLYLSTFVSVIYKQTNKQSILTQSMHYSAFFA